MSYAQKVRRRPLRGMGSTATDAAAIATAAGTIAAQLIAAGRGTSPTDTTMTTSSIDPTTGMPYGAINPATGLPYGTPVAPASDYTIPLVIGGLLLVGVGGYFFMRKSKSTPNRRRRSRRNSRRRSSRMVRRNAAALSTWNKAWSAALKRANQTGTTTHFGMVNGVREMWAGSAPAGAEHITTVEPTKKFFAGSAFAGRAKGGSRRSRKRSRRNSRRSSLRRNALYGLSASGRGLHAIATDPDLTRIYHHQRDAEAALARLMRKAGDEGQHIQWTIQYRGGHGIVKMPVTYFTRFPLPSLRSLGPLRPRS